MFEAYNKERKFIHDIRLAALLSAAAGSVNASSFFAFEIFTTNITGHVAVFATELVANNSASAQLRLLWLLAFFAGAFFSGLCIEFVGSQNTRFSHTIPILLEMSILAVIGWYGSNYDYSRQMTQLFAGSLLFAMGMQNAMVTMVSGSVIRTTHLTGLFTDLGINWAKFVFLRFNIRKNKMLFRKIILHSAIVIAFFAGAFGGGFLFAQYLFKSFLFPLCILAFALVYDATYIRIRKYQADIFEKNEEEENTKSKVA